MSAWHLPTIHMTIVRDGLVQHDIMDKEKADKFILGLAKMNKYALKCRYGDNVKVTKVHPHMCYNVTKESLLSMLQCVRYQCAEGDTDTKYPTLWNQLMRTTGKLAEDILSSQRTYGKDTPWGICSKQEMLEHTSITLLRQAQA